MELELGKRKENIQDLCSDDSVNEPFMPTDDEKDPDYHPSESKQSKQRDVRDYFNIKSKKRSRVPPQSGFLQDQEYDSSTSTNTDSLITNATPPLTSPSSSQTGSSLSLPTPLLLDGKYFQIVEKSTTSSHLKVQCQICLPAIKYLKGSLSSTANFLKHLKTKHSSTYKEYLKYKETRKRTRFEAVDTDLIKTKKQSNIPQCFAKSKAVTQSDFDNRIVKFVVHTMSPVSIIENPSFTGLFDGMGVNVMSRRTVITRISRMAQKKVFDLKDSFTNIKYFCTTADIWSCKSRSFLGVTCHWLNENLDRKSAALACKRFSGAHTYDKIAEHLEDVHILYGLDPKKVVATVTDNGSNFVKAFKIFGVQLQLPSRVNGADGGRTTENDSEVSAAEDETLHLEEEEDEDIFLPTPMNMDGTGDEGEEEIIQPSLPNHYRCASHTLSLIATNDITKIINSNHAHRSRHTSIMNKCSMLWNKAGRPKSAEIIKETLGHTISYPGITRWNSFYDAITQILKNKVTLPSLYEKLGIKNYIIKDNEFVYLDEYCQVLKPIALTLDVLQGEKSVYFGYVLPSLLSLRVKLMKLKQNDFKYMTSVLDGCITSLERRFSDYFALNESANNAIIAAVTHPMFKLRWLSLIKDYRGGVADADSLRIKNLVISEAKKLANEKFKNDKTVDQQDQLLRASTSSAEDTFFEFENATNMNTSHKDGNDKQIELQLLQYLQDTSADIAMLQKYDYIKEVFNKFNTPLPSSAPVERLFSYATFINAPRRHALTDKNFENLVLLKANGF